MKSSIVANDRKIYCLRIESATSSSVVRLVSYPHNIDIGGDTYFSDATSETSDYSTTATMAPPSIDFSGTLDAAGISRATIEQGVWDSARCYVFATDWSAPVVDEEPIGKFILGQFTLEDDRYMVTLMHIIDALNQEVGRTVSPICSWTLFDETLDGRVVDSRLSKCTLNINDFKVTGTITSVTDSGVFADSSRTETDDYFAVGEFRFTSGDNAGQPPQRVKSYSSDTFTMFFAYQNAVQVGDAYEAVPGCRGRFAEDCVTKFNNGINNGSFPDVPISSVYAQQGAKQ